MHDKPIAVITGAAHGIGTATVHAFTSRGYTVAAMDILLEGQLVADKANANGGECIFLQCDVSKEEQVARCIQAIEEKYSRIDVLVNLAGIVLVKPFETISWDEYQCVFDVNVGGTFLMCRYTIPLMKKQKRGVIINIGSVSGHVGQTEHVLDGATKGAIIAMTRALAWELAPDNIRVNSISPGSVDTPSLRSDIHLESRRIDLPFEELKKEREAEQAFKRWADPSEIAEPIYFLASNGASFVTGSDWLVDCGWVAK